MHYSFIHAGLPERECVKGVNISLPKQIGHSDKDGSEVELFCFTHQAPLVSAQTVIIDLC